MACSKIMNNSPEARPNNQEQTNAKTALQIAVDIIKLDIKNKKLEEKINLYERFVRTISDISNKPDEIEKEEIHQDVEEIVDEIFRSIFNVNLSSLEPLEQREIQSIIESLLPEYEKVDPEYLQDEIKKLKKHLEETDKENSNSPNGLRSQA